MSQDHWLPGFNFNVERWDAEGLHHETLAICRTLALARAVFAAAVAEKQTSRLMIHSLGEAASCAPRPRPIMTWGFNDVRDDWPVRG
jgi:hypothetical protein